MRPRTPIIITSIALSLALNIYLLNRLTGYYLLIACAIFVWTVYFTFAIYVVGPLVGDNVTLSSVANDEGLIFMEEKDGCVNFINESLRKIIDDNTTTSVKILVLKFDSPNITGRDETFTLLRKMTTMAELELRYHRVTRQDYLYLGSFLRDHGNLWSLTIQFGELIKTTLQSEEVSHLFNGMMHLTRLALIGVLFTSDALHNLVERLSDGEVIETLELKGCGLDVNCCNHLRSFLLGNKHLLYLRLTWNSFGDEGCRMICESLHDNNALRFLSLRSNRISTEGFESLAGLLKKNDTISCLVVSGNDASNIHLTDFPSQLERTRSLEGLCIRNCNLNDTCYWHIFGALSRNISLKELRLSHISDASCAYLAFVLIRENDTLKRICLGDINDASSDALESFVSCLRYNTSIIEFNPNRECTTDRARLRLLAQIDGYIWINRCPNTPAFAKKAQLSSDLKLSGSFFYDLEFVMDVLDHSTGK